jgi:hypothetical protein
MLTPTAQAGVRDNLRASVDLGTNINGLRTGQARAGVPGESDSVELESKPLYLWAFASYWTGKPARKPGHL